MSGGRGAWGDPYSAPLGAIHAARVQLKSLTRICASLGLRMKFITLFMSDEEKHGHHFDLPLFFNIPMQCNFWPLGV